MKKLIVIGLVLSMAFCMFGCGGTDSEADDRNSELTAIPLGGNLGDFQTEGVSGMGKYTEVEVSDVFAGEDGVETHVYYSEDSDTPYIATYRWDGQGNSLETETEYVAEHYGKSIAQYSEIVNDDGSKSQFGYFSTYGDFDGALGDGYFYVCCVVLPDGTDFVEIDFYSASDEFKLGDTDRYIWLPKGITDIMTDEERDHNTLLFGTYDDDYCFPTIWISQNNLGYEALEWTWSEIWPEGLPFDEDTFNSWVEDGWSAEDDDECYRLLGLTDKVTVSDNYDGCKVTRNYGRIQGKQIADIYVWLPDGNEINIWLEREGEPNYYLGDAISASLHSK